MFAKLRQWARREPVLAVRLVGTIAALSAWVATRYLNVTLDVDELVLLATLALGLDTLVTREGVYTPATVDRLQAEAHAAGEQAALRAGTHTHQDPA